MRKILLLLLLLSSNCWAVTDVDCLTEAIYFEARGEPEAGKIAVAASVLNRSRIKNKSLCEIVYAPNQYSWTAKKPKVREPDAYLYAQKLAARLASGQIKYDRRITHFVDFQSSGKLRWTASLKKLYIIGQHLFFSES